MLCSIINTRVLIATKQSCLPAGAELSAAWVSLIWFPLLSLEHNLSRFWSKCSPCLGFGNFQQELCGELGRTAVSRGRQREKEGGDAHTALDLKCWQLLCLAWVPRAPGGRKAGAGGSRAGVRGQELSRGRDSGQG